MQIGIKSIKGTKVNVIGNQNTLKKSVNSKLGLYDEINIFSGRNLYIVEDVFHCCSLLYPSNYGTNTEKLFYGNEIVMNNVKTYISANV